MNIKRVFFFFFFNSNYFYLNKIIFKEGKMSFLPPPQPLPSPQQQQYQQHQYPYQHNYGTNYQQVPFPSNQQHPYPPNYFQSNFKQIYETPRIFNNQTNDNYLHGVYHQHHPQQIHPNYDNLRPPQMNPQYPHFDQFGQVVYPQYPPTAANNHPYQFGKQQQQQQVKQTFN
jgi:hypothetical protein